MLDDGRVFIPRVPYRRAHELPMPAWGVDQAGLLFIRCGGCGITAGLDHTVEPNGDVSPSLVCPCCGWHEWGTLEGWLGFGHA